MEMESLGSRLRAARKARGFTLAAAAELCETSTNSLWRWENERHSVMPLALRGLAAVYGVSYEELCGHGEGGAASGPDTTADLLEARRDFYASLLEIASRTGLTPEEILGFTKRPVRRCRPVRRRRRHGRGGSGSGFGRRMD